MLVDQGSMAASVLPCCRSPPACWQADCALLTHLHCHGSQEEPGHHTLGQGHGMAVPFWLLEPAPTHSLQLSTPATAHRPVTCGMASISQCNRPVSVCNMQKLTWCPLPVPELNRDITVQTGICFKQLPDCRQCYGHLTGVLATSAHAIWHRLAPSKWAANAHDKGCKLKGQIAPQVGMHSAGRCTKSREYLGHAVPSNSAAV